MIAATYPVLSLGSDTSNDGTNSEALDALLPLLLLYDEVDVPGELEEERDLEFKLEMGNATRMN